MRTIMISGGGTGIGLAVARHFASEPARVVWVGRRRGVLETAANALKEEFPAATVTTLAADLSEPEEAGRLPAAVAGVGAEVVDVLVAAAGGVDRSPVAGWHSWPLSGHAIFVRTCSRWSS